VSSASVCNAQNEKSIPACQRLTQLKVPNASVTLAQTTSAGSYSGPADVFTGRDLSRLYKSLPAFCRVEVTARPTSDSDIKIALWMPVSGWNGRFQGFGNGGFAGGIDYGQIASALRLGYAASATDAGHSGSPGDAVWAVGHPEKVIDFGYRGIHEMTRVSKIIIQSFYGSPAKHSYFAGCPDGGREALMEAQQPADYEGILAGDPANNWVPLVSLGVYDAQALTVDPASYIPPAKLPVINTAVNAECDGLDGIRDGILNDPRACHFDPAIIQCKTGEDLDKCLTAPQVAALKKIYAGLPDSSKRSLNYYLGNSFYAYFVHHQADWDYKTFTVAKDEKMAESTLGPQLDATDPDLKPFASHGGKLMMYHGWNDPAIPALNSINYFESIRAKLGARAADSFPRLYMVPGMLHCIGGSGPDVFRQMGIFTDVDSSDNMRLSLQQWTEAGTGPGAIIASKHDPANWSVTMTRPLCPYPQAAKYDGTGDTTKAANFACTER
jgi:tannase/feruloyl esterase